MKNVLVVNSGSSSLKLSLFQFRDEEVVCLFEAYLKGIRSSNVLLDVTSASGKEHHVFPKSIGIPEGLRLIIDMVEPRYKDVFSSLAGIGHRFVHGGDQYRSSIRINQEIILDLQKLIPLAPLHNGACLEGIMACFSCFGSEIPQVAVFDTAFHSSLPPVASHYAISKEIAEKYKIKRYGFHGISHAFLWNAYVKDPSTSKEAKIITLHLGAGCSMTAIRVGVSIDT